MLHYSHICLLQQKNGHASCCRFRCTHPASIYNGNQPHRRPPVRHYMIICHSAVVKLCLIKFYALATSDSLSYLQEGNKRGHKIHAVASTE